MLLSLLSKSSKDESGIPLVSLFALKVSRVRLVPPPPKVLCAALEKRVLLLPVEEDSPMSRGAKCLEKRRKVERQQHMMSRLASTKLSRSVS
jgi:hypothetical protein